MPGTVKLARNADFDADDDIRDLMAMEVEELGRRLLALIGNLVDNYREGARIIRALDRKGVDLSAYPMQDVLHDYRMVACGRLLPETVARFGDRPLLMQKIGGLPPEDQRRIVIDNEGIQTVVPDPETGKLTPRMIRPEDMRPNVISQVFTPDGRIRTVAAQSAVIDARNLERRAAVTQRIGEHIVVNPDNGTVEVFGRIVPPEDIQRAARALRALAR